MKEFGPRLIPTGSVTRCSVCGHVFFPDQEDDMAKAFTDHIRKAHRAKDDGSQLCESQLFFRYPISKSQE